MELDNKDETAAGAAAQEGSLQEDAMDEEEQRHDSGGPGSAPPSSGVAREEGGGGSTTAPTTEVAPAAAGTVEGAEVPQLGSGGEEEAAVGEEEVAGKPREEGGGGVSGKQRIYVAGKMMFFNAPGRDWRGLGRFKELEWRSDEEALPLLDKMRSLRDVEVDWDENWVYVGPHFLSCPGLDHDVDYFYQLDDEPRSGAALASVLRDEQRDFTVDEREKQVLYDNARHQISKCDVLYARLTDQKDCFWTLTEIGIAAGMGKRVYIDCPVESHDTWLFPLLSEHSKGTRGTLTQERNIVHRIVVVAVAAVWYIREEYVSIPWAMYKH